MMPELKFEDLMVPSDDHDTHSHGVERTDIACYSSCSRSVS